MQPGDLTTLDNVKTWLAISGVSATDSLLARLISSVSTFIQSWLNRTIRNLPYSETRSGQGGQAMMLLNYPVTSVDSLMIDGIVVPPRPALGAISTQSFIGFGSPWGPAGYTFDGNRVMLSGGYQFCRGFSNIAVTYAAGFLVSNESGTIPAVAPYIINTTTHWNAGDRGVVYASNGLPLTALLYGSALGLGQYSVDADGVYHFASADAGTAVLLSYGYIPFDIEQAAVDMIGDWFKYKSRIGITAEAIEQQSTTFTNTAITSRAQGVLNQYKRVFPVQT